MTADRWMQRALELAHTAARQEEVPVGAVVVADDRCIGEGYNRTIMDHDPSAHAEIVALRAAATAMGNHRLPQATLYVTLEPCAMCAGAIIQARVQRVVFAATDPKAGAVQSIFQLLDDPRLNHRTAWQGGILADPCSTLLKSFFLQRR